VNGTLNISSEVNPLKLEMVEMFTQLSGI